MYHMTRRAVGGETSPSFSKGQVAWPGLRVSQSELICGIDRYAKVSGE